MSLAAALVTLLIGDSITASSFEGFVSAPVGPAYADLVEAATPASNWGTPGSSSADWTAFAPTCQPGGTASVLIGTNDALGTFGIRPPTDPADYRANLELAAERLLTQAGCSRVVLMTAPRNFAFGADVASRLQGYRSEVLDLCAVEPGVECGPDLWALLGPADFAPGNIHPNGSGHAKIAAALLPVLVPAVPVPLSVGAALAALLLLSGFRRLRQR